MNEYNWTISALDCKVKENGLENVIENVHWRYGNDKADVYGVISLPSPIPSEFEHIDSVTKEMVIEWLIPIFSVKNKKYNPAIDGEEEVIEYEEFSKLELMQQELYARIELIDNPIMVTKYL